MFKLKIKTSGQRHWCRSLLLTYFKPCSSVSIVKFEHVIAGRETVRNYSFSEEF